VVTLARILLFIAALTAFVMAILPHPPEVPVVSWDKLQHMAAFAVLAGLAALGFPRSSPFVVLAGLALFGGLIELVQAIPAIHRDSDAFDWLADIGAGAVVLALAEFWRRVSCRQA
jgi:hypothetical protein